ncbi:hypothetical protein [Methylobacterium nodulans]|nr:hypothetical protein [Methylobacterium nodulans]
MSNRRSFKESPVREDGKTVFRYQLTCGECGHVGSLSRQNFGPERASDLVPRKFEQLGWRVGRAHDGHSDRCPTCRGKAEPAGKPQLRVVDPKTEETLPAQPAARGEPPREMGRDDRRLIFAKLNDVYVDEVAGYAMGWTDGRVATDLGVPCAWVTAIRAEMFGPGVSAEMTQFLGEAKALRAELDQLRPAAEAMAGKVEALEQRLAAIEGTAHRIQTELAGAA